ncbi:hypothetical protein [Arthrobacter oryzae]|uniref:hypothetical protein n=1 Tax=Arthrobacter oryzae TaxID=409290 RepID=UPI003593C614
MARALGLHGATVVLASRSDDGVAAAVGRLRAEGIAASGSPVRHRRARGRGGAPGRGHQPGDVGHLGQ